MNRSRAPFTSAITPLRSLSLSLLLALAGGCGPMPGEASEPEPEPEAEAVTDGLRAGRPPAFVGVEETFTSDEDWTRWFELTRALRHDFGAELAHRFATRNVLVVNRQRFALQAQVEVGHRLPRPNAGAK